jgi:hypothetical protein
LQTLRSHASLWRPPKRQRSFWRATCCGCSCHWKLPSRCTERPSGSCRYSLSRSKGVPLLFLRTLTFYRSSLEMLFACHSYSGAVFVQAQRCSGPPTVSLKSRQIAAYPPEACKCHGLASDTKGACFCPSIRREQCRRLFSIQCMSGSVVLARTLSSCCLREERHSCFVVKYTLRRSQNLRSTTEGSAGSNVFPIFKHTSFFLHQRHLIFPPFPRNIKRSFFNPNQDV